MYKTLLFSTLFLATATTVNAQLRPGDVPCHINNNGVIVDLSYMCGTQSNQSDQPTIRDQFAEAYAIEDPFLREVTVAELSAEISGRMSLGDFAEKNKIAKCLRDFYREGGSLAVAKASCGAY